MVRTFTFIFSLTLLISFSTASAQCNVDYTDTVEGFYPKTLPCIVQGAVYGEVLQVFVPDSIPFLGLEVQIDSIRLDSIVGLPSGITYTPNPASAIIHGGTNGCLWFSGTT